MLPPRMVWLAPRLTSWVSTIEYTECWPCPLFYILLNKYCPAGQPSGRQETPVFCWATIAENVLHRTYPQEYQICSSQPRQKQCWANSLRIQPLGCPHCHHSPKHMYCNMVTCRLTYVLGTHKYFFLQGGRPMLYFQRINSENSQYANIYDYWDNI